MSRYGAERKLAVMRHYDAIASCYDELYGDEQRVKYEEILDVVPPRGLALDVGCGTGSLLRKLSGRCTRAVGVDLSIGMLRQAKTKLRGLEDVDLIRADAEALPLRDRMFDVVYAVTVFQNLPSPDRGLQEICRVLSDGGVAAISVLEAAGLKLYGEGALRICRVMSIPKDTLYIFRRVERYKTGTRARLSREYARGAHLRYAR